MATRAADARLAVDLQRAGTGMVRLPSPAELRRWARLAYDGAGDAGEAEVTLRLVGAAEGKRLNEGFRPGKQGPTNVLAFPAPPSPTRGRQDSRPLGDIVICVPVVRREAREQGKPLRAHLAHMVVHGTLHLLGHTHDRGKDTRAMEGLERKILMGLGFPDPYGRQAAPARAPAPATARRRAARRP